MTIEDIIESLKDQARDKDNLAGGDPDSIFTHDAAVLREAADALRAKQSHAKLYDNDAYFDEFKDGVYDLLADDPTWDRANQIIDAFDMAPTVEAEPLPLNNQLTLDELRKMDGKPVWLVGADDAKIERNGYAAVDFRYFGSKNVPVIFWFGTAIENEPDPENYGKTWTAYRRKPEEETK